MRSASGDKVKKSKRKVDGRCRGRRERKKRRNQERKERDEVKERTMGERERGGNIDIYIERERQLCGETKRAEPRIMAGDNPVARINSQIFQSRNIKGCKLHFWSNAPGGYAVQRFQRESRRDRLVECGKRDNRFINQIKSMIEWG